MKYLFVIILLFGLSLFIIPAVGITIGVLKKILTG
jgi:hypothetical protein